MQKPKQIRNRKFLKYEYFLQTVFTESDECIEWPFAKGKLGYGSVQLPSKKQVGVHRLAYETVYGPLGDLLCCHKCDNRACYNPRHLFAGTAKDNTLDMMSKGRFVKIPPRLGPENNKTVLTEEGVRYIRNTYQKNVKGFGISVIAKKLGVSQCAVTGVLKGTTWSWLP